MQVTRRDGRVLLEVRGAGLLVGTDSGEAGKALEDFTGDGQPELHLLAWSGGAYCCYTDLLFQQTETAVRNSLVFEGRLSNLGKGAFQSATAFTARERRYSIYQRLEARPKHAADTRVTGRPIRGRHQSLPRTSSGAGAPQGADRQARLEWHHGRRPVEQSLR